METAYTFFVTVVAYNNLVLMVLRTHFVV